MTGCCPASAHPMAPVVFCTIQPEPLLLPMSSMSFTSGRSCPHSYPPPRCSFLPCTPQQRATSLLAWLPQSVFFPNTGVLIDMTPVFYGCHREALCWLSMRIGWWKVVRVRPHLLRATTPHPQQPHPCPLPFVTREDQNRLQRTLVSLHHQCPALHRSLQRANGCANTQSYFKEGVHMIVGLTALTPAGGPIVKSPQATMPRAQTGRIPSCSGSLRLPFYLDLQMIRCVPPTLYLVKT